MNLKQRKARLWSELKSEALKGMEHVVNEQEEVGIVDVIVRNTIGKQGRLTTTEYAAELCETEEGKWFTEDVVVRRVLDPEDNGRRWIKENIVRRYTDPLTHKDYESMVEEETVERIKEYTLRGTHFLKGYHPKEYIDFVRDITAGILLEFAEHDDRELKDEEYFERAYTIVHTIDDMLRIGQFTKSGVNWEEEEQRLGEEI